MNRDKTEQVFFEDAIGCTIDQAYQDMVATKKRFHKTDKVQGFHLVQSFAEGEVSPELAHLIGVELVERLLRGQFEVVITTHLNTSHFHNHLVWNSVSMEDGHKYHSNEQSYYMEVRKISDELCRKYGLSVIQTNQEKGIHYAQWKAEKEGKPTWRTAIRSDIREAVKASYSWTQFVKEMETRGYVWRTDRKYLALKAPGMERYVRLRSLGKGYGEMEIREWILRPKIRETEKVYLGGASKQGQEKKVQTVSMPEGTIEFEIDESDQKFDFGDMFFEEGNFTQGKEEKLPSGTSSPSRDFSSGQKNREHGVKPSVREEIKEIKKEQAQKNRQKQSRQHQKTKGRKYKKKGKGR